MLTFATPWVLAVGALASTAIVTLHFLSVQRPPALLLPTARFLDEGATRAVSRSAKPSDVLLMLLRVAALVLSSIALAGPRWVSARATSQLLVVADVAMRKDSAALASRDGVTQFVWMDSVDAAGAAAGLRVTLTSALPMAVRAAAMTASQHPEVDSFRLRIIAVPHQRVDDDGWRAWRSAWPGAVQVVTRDTSGQLVRAVDASRGANRALNATLAGEAAPTSIGTATAISAASSTAMPRAAAVARVEFDSIGADDPVRAAFAIRSAPSKPSTGRDAVAQRVVRVSRGAIAVPRATGIARTATENPSIALTDPTNAVVTVRWPSSGVPVGWESMRDTSSAVAARGLALVGRWSRTSRVSASALRGAHPIAWWADGSVAALERATSTGCTRDVGIVVPPSSELLIDPAADALLAALLAPCSGAIGSASSLPAFVRDDSLDRSHGAAAPASAFRTTATSRTVAVPEWLAPLLLMLAIVLLLVEWVLRARIERNASASDRSAGREPPIVRSGAA